MLVNYQCTCGESYHIPETLIGRQIRCPFCFALNSVVETGPDGEPLVNDAASAVGDNPSPRSRSRWLAYTALSLAIPLGGIVGVKAMGGRHEGEGGSFVRNPATTRENGLPIKAVALAAPEGERSEPGQAAPRPVQQAAPQPSGPLDSFLGLCDPIFVDPSATRRLEILHKMICEFNDADEVWVIRGTLVGSREERHARYHRASIPDADELKAWLKNLSPRQRVAIAWEFNDRERYLTIVREAVKKGRETGKMNWDGPSGGHDVAMFKDVDDVFISPNDGLPFLIGLTRIQFSRQGFTWKSNVIAREQTGVRTLDRRFLEYLREVQCVKLKGEVDQIYEKDEGEEKPTTPPHTNPWSLLLPPPPLD